MTAKPTAITKEALKRKIDELKAQITEINDRLAKLERERK